MKTNQKMYFKVEEWHDFVIQFKLNMQHGQKYKTASIRITVVQNKCGYENIMVIEKE